MESIVGVDFLAFPVSFDLVDEAMHFCLKIKLCLKTLKIIENLLIQLVYAFVWNISLCMKYQSTNTHIFYTDLTIDFSLDLFRFSATFSGLKGSFLMCPIIWHFITYLEIKKIYNNIIFQKIVLRVVVALQYHTDHLVCSHHCCCSFCHCTQVTQQSRTCKIEIEIKNQKVYNQNISIYNT